MGVTLSDLGDLGDASSLSSTVTIDHPWNKGDASVLLTII